MVKSHHSKRSGSGSGFPEMPVATIIDIGTNTFEYLIVEYSGSDFNFLAEDKIHVRLGEGVSVVHEHRQ